MCSCCMNLCGCPEAVWVRLVTFVLVALRAMDPISDFLLLYAIFYSSDTSQLTTSIHDCALALLVTISIREALYLFFIIRTSCDYPPKLSGIEVDELSGSLIGITFLVLNYILRKSARLCCGKTIGVSVGKHTDYVDTDGCDRISVGMLSSVSFFLEDVPSVTLNALILSRPASSADENYRLFSILSLSVSGVLCIHRMATSCYRCAKWEEYDYGGA